MSDTPLTAETPMSDAEWLANLREIAWKRGHSTATVTTQELRALLTRLDAAESDWKRFEWFFGPDDKMAFLPTYLTGVGQKWTVAQWRVAIDNAIAARSR